MHLSGKSVAAIGALMDVTVKTVRTTIRSMNEQVTGVKLAEGPEGPDAFQTDDAAEDPPTRASSICQQAIEDRQKFVDSLIYERNEDDRFSVNCARDIRKRLRETSLPFVSLRTLQGSQSSWTQVEIEAGRVRHEAPSQRTSSGTRPAASSA